MIGPVFALAQRCMWRLRGELLARYVRMMGGHAGKHIYAESGVHFRYPPNSTWDIGDRVFLARGAVIASPGRLVLGERVHLMQWTLVAAVESIEIGARTMIAERCSIRDSNHAMDVGAMFDAPHVTSPVVIGKDVWIGCGVAVLAGAQIGEHSVIGANSVVSRNIPDNVVAFGAPARVHRARVDSVSDPDLPKAAPRTEALE